jgi:hypothetical protein
VAFVFLGFRHVTAWRASSDQEDQRAPTAASGDLSGFTGAVESGCVVAFGTR